MEFRQLGKTDIKVSAICLGTMTFGEQNTESEAHEQMSYALEQGVNFFDTAELYAVPSRKETQGLSEKIIGTWFKKTGNRDKVVLGTKAAGPAPNLYYISENLGFSKGRLLEAIDLSLSRLQTDYIDLYQLHWPERKTNYFGVRGYTTHDNQWEDNFEEALDTLNELKKQGKIRHYGLSNETPWGVMRNLNITRSKGYEDCVSIQNCYNLLNRLFEVGLSEMAIRESCGLLAYSPMAFGLLSGKYHTGTDRSDARLNKFSQMSRYNSEQCHEATRRYLEIAEDNHMNLAQMSLAFINQMPFVTSNIIGATSMEQLKENIASIYVKLSKGVLKEIEEVHNAIPNPAP
ncbi:MAG: aldo/keto reductase [Saprospiraceae bacterium]|nr:aldo/keto reductase [Saprospiraceae bacterium]